MNHRNFRVTGSFLLFTQASFLSFPMLGGGLAQLVMLLVASTKLINAEPG